MNKRTIVGVKTSHPKCKFLLIEKLDVTTQPASYFYTNPLKKKRVK